MGKWRVGGVNSSALYLIWQLS